MKDMRKILMLFLVGAVFFTACYDDKGNYVYQVPDAPVVTNLDSVYNARVGDSLIIEPKVTIKEDVDLRFEWKINDPNATREIRYASRSLRILFGLDAKRYTALLTITNPENGMKYFYDFAINGITEFNTGTLVLSSENNVSQLSFVQPDGKVQARLFKAINGYDLPADPVSVVLLANMNYNPPNPLGYWIFTKHGGVKLKVSNLVADRSLAENFFEEPESIEVGSAKALKEGAPLAVINNKLYAGTTYTWDQSPTYGMFGLSAQGDYEMAPSFVFNSSLGYFIGFDRKKKQFLRFNNYGTATYFGTSYAVTSNEFNPTNVGMDLLHLEQVNEGDCYAFCKDPSGAIYELQFSVVFTGPFNFTPKQKRLFVRQDLIQSDTKWVATQSGVFYFTSGSKIYRYNPINLEVREITTTFGGKRVSMIKLLGQNTLVAGVEGSLYYLDISVGKYGDLIKTVNDIPGEPVDFVVR